MRANGGVLSREDIYNYTVEVEQPVEGLYNGMDLTFFKQYTAEIYSRYLDLYCVFFVSEFIIQVPPPPSAGAALISALSLLQGFHLNENNNTENQTYHWIDEVMDCKASISQDFFHYNRNWLK